MNDLQEQFEQFRKWHLENNQSNRMDRLETKMHSLMNDITSIYLRLGLVERRMNIDPLLNPAHTTEESKRGTAE